MADIVVVGAGMGGLASALRLAAAGHRVTVCEAAPQVGGKLGRRRSNGFTFDTGPSLLTMPQVFAELFSDVGERIDDHLDLEPLHPVARYRWSDGTCLDVHSEADATAASLRAALGPEAERDWRQLLERAGRMWRAVEEPVLRSASRGAATFAPLARNLSDLRAIAPTRTLRDVGHAYLRDPRLRMMLDRYATYTGSDPRRAPAALLTVLYAEAAFGGWYIRGGLYRLAEVTAALAAERGADIRLGAHVDHIATAGGAVTGVVLRSGERLPADAVVADVDVRRLYGVEGGGPGLLGGDLGAVHRIRRRLATTPRSLSGFVLLLGVDAADDGTAQHTVFFPTDYDAEFDALFGPDPRPVDQPTIYLHRPADPSQAPAGTEAWFLLVNAPRHGDQFDWDAPGVSHAYRNRVLDLLAARGVDVRDRIRTEHVISPADLERATGASGGAIYGSSSNGVAAAFLRAANVGPVRGLFVVGGSAHPGGGLPLVALSAASVSRLVGDA